MFLNDLYEDKQLILNTLKNRIIPLEPTQEKGIKKLIPKKTLQRLPIALAQLKPCNGSKNLLKETVKSYILFIKPKKPLKSISN